MDYNPIHGFGQSEPEMLAMQSSLASQVSFAPSVKPFNVVSGFDISYGKEYAVAALVTADKAMNCLETTYVVGKPTFDYASGLLAFRELPLFLEVWKKATVEPDVVVFDGNGVMHERRLGVASHASFFIQKPTIGVAKTYHLGSFDPVGLKVGDYSLIVDKGAVVGAAVRTCKGANPVFVSVGNGLSLEQSIDLIVTNPAYKSKQFKLTLMADHVSRKILAELEG